MRSEVPSPAARGDSRFSPKRGFDKLVLSVVDELSLSGWEFDFKGLFPLTLSYYR